MAPAREGRSGSGPVSREMKLKIGPALGVG